MKLIVGISAAVLAAGLLAGSAGTASAQADRTLGVGCTVAGHVHCGEYGTRYPYYAYSPYHRHWHRHYYRHRHYY
jgi:hypothetical protein